MSDRQNRKRFVAHFGMAIPLAALYKDLKAEYPQLREKEFFMGLDFLRCYPTMSQMAGQ